MMGVLAKVKMVIILQHISVSDQLMAHFKLAQCCMSIISQWRWENKKFQKVQVTNVKKKKEAVSNHAKRTCKWGISINHWT